ncbi:hypothetical protein [Saccharothrix sp.]|uniref:hypothetical protein n=1 Tax=Saccharothrix sp. TaxID=1873460 RepID=UPI0028116CCE|nr:hypothetical protein [Saccharothrix sp.]
MHGQRGDDHVELRPDLDLDAAAWWLLSVLASQKFRRATAPDSDAVEARLAESTLAFLLDR